MLHALRTFRRTPALTTVALSSIAITIGATAVVFTAIKTVLIDPLPYANADELVQFRTESSRGGDSRADWVTWPDMQDVNPKESLLPLRRNLSLLPLQSLWRQHGAA